VVWDLGNVLIDWQPELAVAAGVGEAEARRFMAADDFDFMAYNHGPDSGGAWAEAEDAVRRSHPHWAEHALAYRANFVASLVGEVPGSVDLVRELHRAGVPMWGLTNWSHDLYPHAPERFDFLSLLEGVVVSGTEKVAKPDPRIFELTVARTGLPADRLVFVDDREPNVEAAVASGMDGIVFTGADGLRAALRDRGLPV
jgi:2-haloacid dehalogenase